MSRLCLLIAIFACFSMASLRAQENMTSAKPDDSVVYSLSAEDWVTTKTARVTANVEAAVSATNAGSLRTDMIKAVNDLAKADWRLTTFNRNLDQTGLERWSASFEARVPETELNGLNDSAKKLSKAGMQLSIGDIDFSPTLDETETARAGLRTKLYKEINDQLTSLNAALPGRNYRIAMIGFGAEGIAPPAPPVPAARPGVMRAMVAMAAPVQADPDDESAEKAEKIILTARVMFAAASPDTKH